MNSRTLHAILLWLFASHEPVGSQVPQTWCAVGPESARAAVEPLRKHRLREGFQASFLAIESLKGEEPLNERVRSALLSAKPRPTHILLIGDGAGPAANFVIPPFRIPRGDPVKVVIDGVEKMMEWDPIESDLPFGDFDRDDLPEAHVGRFPVRNLPELESAVRKTIDYESSLRGGLWQRQAAFITGEGHYGAFVDTMIERTFAKIVDETFQKDIDVDVTYANPKSAYFWPEREFAEFVKGRLQRGALFCTYVGHGMPDSVDSIRTPEGRFPVLGMESLKTLGACEAPAIFTILACWTGDFAKGYDGILEALWRHESGPVAGLGATIPSAPYGNGVLGLELGRAYQDRATARLGDAIDQARRALLQGSGTWTRTQIDLLAKLFDSKSDQATELLEHVRMYVLFGDPALRIRRPLTGAHLEVSKVLLVGSELKLKFDAPEGATSALVTLDCERTAMKKALPPSIKASSPKYAGRVKERHQIANDKVMVRYEGPVKLGVNEVLFQIPANLEPGDYVVKLALFGAKDLITGFETVKIMAPQ